MHLYILRSAPSGRYYIGTTEDVEYRLAQHNAPETNPSRWTRSHGPWELVYAKLYHDKTSALRGERYVKKMKSRRFIEKLLSGEYVLPEFED